jgi:hypothetical protein
MPIMLPSLSLNHAARVGPVVAMPLSVFEAGKVGQFGLSGAPGRN